MKEQIIGASLGIVALIVAAACPAEGKTNAWLLNQICPSFPTGHCSIELSDAGIKVATKDVSLLLPAPDYHAKLVNTKAKVYCDLTLEEALKKFFKSAKYNSAEEALAATHTRPGQKTAQVAGWKAKQYFVYTKEKKGERLSHEYWATDEIKGLPEKTLSIARMLCQLPPGEGVPLKVVKVQYDGTKTIITSTDSIKKTTADKSAFTTPKDFKHVKNELQVLLQGGDEELTDILGEPKSKQ